MAEVTTIEELERETRELVEAEQRAFADLAAYLRGLAVGLPTGSVIARRFEQAAGEFDRAADWKIQWSALALHKLTSEAVADADETWPASPEGDED